jgi:hypothetical protein
MAIHSLTTPSSVSHFANREFLLKYHVTNEIVVRGGEIRGHGYLEDEAL